MSRGHWSQERTAHSCSVLPCGDIKGLHTVLLLGEQAECVTSHFLGAEISDKHQGELARGGILLGCGGLGGSAADQRLVTL